MSVAEQSLYIYFISICLSNLEEGMFVNLPVIILNYIEISLTGSEKAMLCAHHYMKRIVMMLYIPSRTD